MQFAYPSRVIRVFLPGTVLVLHDATENLVNRNRKFLNENKALVNLYSTQNRVCFALL